MKADYVDGFGSCVDCHRTIRVENDPGRVGNVTAWARRHAAEYPGHRPHATITYTYRWPRRARGPQPKMR